MKLAAIRWPAWLAVATLVGASCALISLATPPPTARAVPAFDIYSYFWPVAIYAADAIRHHGGQGLLWSQMQDCGQPFLGTGVTGVLYPPFLFFLFLDGDLALRALLAFNVVVGALGSYFLCRELGLSRAAAVCGALTFACGHSGLDLITFAPVMSGAYAWTPAAMLFCERILRKPTLRGGIALGIVLTLALLPGHPQLLMYIYQLVGLRVLLEMLMRRSWLGARTLGVGLFGLALPVLLGAVHLVPAIEVMRLSVRNAGLAMAEIEGHLFMFSWATVFDQFYRRRELFNPFLIVPVMLASAAFCTTRLLGQVVFYSVLAVASFDLSFGSEGYLYPMYVDLPLASLFRAPDRFLYIVAFCLSMLVAIGVDAIAPEDRRSAHWPRRLAAVALPITALGLMRWWIPNVGTWTGEPLFIPMVIVACLLAGFSRFRSAAAGALVVAMLLELVVFRQTPFRTLLPSATTTLYSNAAVFRVLQDIMTPQERIHIVERHGDMALLQKTGSLFGIPTLNDYESLATQRFANFVTMLRTGSEMVNLNNFYYPIHGPLPGSTRRRLLDLAAVRYLVVDSTQQANAAHIAKPRLKLVFQHFYEPRPRDAVAGPVPSQPAKGVAPSEYARIYENTTALPRARWVPRVAVVPDPSDLLRRLSDGTHRLEKTALVEEPPASGYLGEVEDTEAEIGTVNFVVNDPEHIVLDVEAPRRGFVTLADQWFPGWRASVNGAPAAMLRANYLFRLVEVPAGRSRVEFRFVPDSLWLGALISALTAFAVAVLLFVTRGRSVESLGLPGESG